MLFWFQICFLVYCFGGTGYYNTVQTGLELISIPASCKECYICVHRSEEGVGPLELKFIDLCEPPDVGYVRGGILTPS